MAWFWIKDKYNLRFHRTTGMTLCLVLDINMQYLFVISEPVNSNDRGRAPLDHRSRMGLGSILYLSHLLCDCVMWNKLRAMCLFRSQHEELAGFVHSWRSTSASSNCCTDCCNIYHKYTQVAVKKWAISDRMFGATQLRRKTKSIRQLGVGWG